MESIAGSVRTDDNPVGERVADLTFPVVYGSYFMDLASFRGTQSKKKQQYECIVFTYLPLNFLILLHFEQREVSQQI